MNYQHSLCQIDYFSKAENVSDILRSGHSMTTTETVVSVAILCNTAPPAGPVAKVAHSFVFVNLCLFLHGKRTRKQYAYKFMY
jgi:hypothetical protein